MVLLRALYFFAPNGKPITVPVENLQGVEPHPNIDKHRSGERVNLKHFLRQSGQPIAPAPRMQVTAFACVCRQKSYAESAMERGLCTAVWSVNAVHNGARSLL